jgi:hypothetical protein
VTESRAAAPAGDQVHRLETEVEQLRSAMASRAAIEQAKLNTFYWANRVIIK